MKLLTGLFLVLLTGCASFTEPAQWTDADYGGWEQRVAYESYEATRSQTRTPINTRARVNGYQTQVSAHLNRKATKTCVDHSVIVLQKMEARGIHDATLMISLKTEGLYHSWIEKNGLAYDVNFGSPVPAADVLGHYDSTMPLGAIKADNVKLVLSELGGTFK